MPYRALTCSLLRLFLRRERLGTCERCSLVNEASIEASCGTNQPVSGNQAFEFDAVNSESHLIPVGQQARRTSRPRGRRGPVPTLRRYVRTHQQGLSSRSAQVARERSEQFPPSSARIPRTNQHQKDSADRHVILDKDRTCNFYFCNRNHWKCNRSSWCKTHGPSSSTVHHRYLMI